MAPRLRFFALSIGNAASAATIVEAMLAPTSMARVVSVVVSLLLEGLARTGVRQRFELCIAARLAAKVELPWQMRFAKMSALELVYLHSLGGTGYIAPTRAACIGCVQSATTTFGDPYAIVWLDVSPTVWQVLLAQVASQVVADAAVLAVQKMGLQQFELSAHFAAGHPLANAVLRAFGLQGYVLVLGQHASTTILALAVCGSLYVHTRRSLCGPRVCTYNYVRVQSFSKQRSCPYSHVTRRFTCSLLAVAFHLQRARQCSNVP